MLFRSYANAERYFPIINEDHPAKRNQMLSLCQSDSPLGDLLRSMLNNPGWMGQLRQKAENNHLDLETVMVQDALWTLHHHSQGQ